MPHVDLGVGRSNKLTCKGRDTTLLEEAIKVVIQINAQ